jgi:hypothetical protein
MRILVVGDVHGNTDFMRTAIVRAVPKLSRCGPIETMLEPVIEHRIKSVRER